MKIEICLKDVAGNKWNFTTMHLFDDPETRKAQLSDILGAYDRSIKEFVAETPEIHGIPLIKPPVVSIEIDSGEEGVDISCK